MSLYRRKVKGETDRGIEREAWPQRVPACSSRSQCSNPSGKDCAESDAIAEGDPPLLPSELSLPTSLRFSPSTSSSFFSPLPLCFFLLNHVFSCSLILIPAALPLASSVQPTAQGCVRFSCNSFTATRLYLLSIST